jgi:serine-type D-Ala-D-Ala carboxypeptidase (penicillin-binding protein 5/6)
MQHGFAKANSYATVDGSDSPVANAALPINVLRFSLTVIPIHRTFIAFAALLILASGARFVAAAQSYVIVDSQTGYVLQEQEARQKRQIGSLTKIATAVVVLDWAEHKSAGLNQIVNIPAEAFADTRENNIGFQPGDAIALRDLLYAALVQSDNIAANALAYHVGSTLESLVPTVSGSRVTPIIAFVSQMNALAKQLKMDRTRFVNPDGIDEKVKPMPFSTAEDMARLAHYAMNKASFRFYVSQKERTISFRRSKGTLNYTLRNTNALLGTHGIDGVKTGQTARAGECLILSANRESEVVTQGESTTVYQRHIIAVLLGSSDRFGEGLGLIQRGWQLYDQWAAAGRLVDPNKVL